MPMVDPPDNEMLLKLICAAGLLAVITMLVCALNDTLGRVRLFPVIVMVLPEYEQLSAVRPSDVQVVGPGLLMLTAASGDGPGNVGDG